MMKLTDTFGRVHEYLRVSLTGNCNLRCMYCNPEGRAITNGHSGMHLKFDDLHRLIRIFVTGFGFKKIRFTGGEPLARKGFEDFLGSLGGMKKKHGLELCMTTNGTLLNGRIGKLKDNGLDRLNISLDSLKQEVFRLITGRDEHEKVIDSINKAVELGFPHLKINCVVIKGINENEILDFIEFVKDSNINIRFIEYMPFTNNGWDEKSFISSDEMKTAVEIKHQLVKIPSNKNSITDDYSIDGFKGTVSFISPISNHFCDSCNRLRITSGGSLRSCLYSERKDEISLKEYLNDKNMSDGDIEKIIHEYVRNKLSRHPAAGELARLDHNYMLRAGG